MKRAVVIVVTVLLVLGVLAPAAIAANQPTRGDSSRGRNEAGHGGGPHCHVLTVDSAQEQFTLWVFPSHTGHANSAAGTFAADFNCNGIADNLES